MAEAAVPPQARRRVSWGRLLLLVLVSAACLWVLLSGEDLGAVAARIAALEPAYLAAAIGCLTGGYFCRVLRWWAMLRALDPSLRLSATAGPFLASIALNNTLPLRAGDAVRVFGFTRSLAAPPSRIFASVAVERLADLVLLSGIAVAGLVVLPAGTIPPWLETAAVAAFGLGVLALAGLIACAPWAARRLARMGEGTVGRRLRGAAAAGSEIVALLATLRAPGRLGLLAWATVLAWGFEGAVFGFVCLGLGLLDPLAPWFGLGLGTLATLVPATPGHLGTFDLATATALEAFGAPSTQAVAVALTVHAILWAPLTLVGLLCLAGRGARWRTPSAPQPGAPA